MSSPGAQPVDLDALLEDSADAPLAEYGEFPDGHAFVCDLLAGVESPAGGPLGREQVGIETPELPRYFIRVGVDPGRAGIGLNGITATFAFGVRCYAPTHREARKLSQQAANTLIALDRGRAHRGVLVDSMFQTSADAPVIERDEDDRSVESEWVAMWRRHFAPTVHPGSG